MEIAQEFICFCSCQTGLLIKQKKYCQSCEQYRKNQLTQQISILKQKQLFYKNQQQEILNLSKINQTQAFQILISNTNKFLKKELYSDAAAEKELFELEKQIKLLQSEQIKENDKINKMNSKITAKSQVLNQIYERQHKLSRQYNKFSQYYVFDMERKSKQLVNLKQLFQNTKFINIFFSILFEDNITFLNNQQIYCQNIWKLVQIQAFYQHKYKGYYRPLTEIHLDSMTICPILSIVKTVKFKQSSQRLKLPDQTEMFQTFQIKCSTAEQVFQWIPYILLQTQNIFQFLKKLAAKSDHMLKYKITQNGQFQNLRQMKQDQNKLNLTIKQLASTLDQANNLEYYITQQKFNLFKQKKTNSQSI